MKKKIQPAKFRKDSRHFEDTESRSLWKWAQYLPILRDYLYHVPNGGSRKTKVEGALMKAMGVRAGVHDYHLPVPRGTYHGLWIELKATPPHDAAVSPGQLEWTQKMKGQGHAVFICKGWQTAIKVFLWYLALPVPEVVECPTLEQVLEEVVDDN